MLLAIKYAYRALFIIFCVTYLWYMNKNTADISNSCFDLKWLFSVFNFGVEEYLCFSSSFIEVHECILESSICLFYIFLHETLLNTFHGCCSDNYRQPTVLTENNLISRYYSPMSEYRAREPFKVIIRELYLQLFKTNAQYNSINNFILISRIRKIMYETWHLMFK